MALCKACGRRRAAVYLGLMNASTARKSKISAPRARVMTEDQLVHAIYFGAGPADARGPSDAFATPAIQAVLERSDISARTWNWFLSAVA
jgi:hypothetical protein